MNNEYDNKIISRAISILLNILNTLEGLKLMIEP